MKSTSKNGIELIKKFEGYLSKASNKLDGVYTCGYGHTRNVKSTTTCTEAIAEAWLCQDLLICEYAVNSYEAYYDFSQNEFDALVSFTYNLGTNNLKKLLRDGTRTRKEISNAWVQYIKCNGKILKGLENRRKEEVALFNTKDSKEDIASVTVEKYYKIPCEKFTSIIDALKSIGENSTLPNRKKIAQFNNITEYKGTAKQNMEMLALLYEGKLKRF